MALFFYKEKNKDIRAAAYLRLSINHKQHPGEFEGASVAYAGRFNFRFYYEKMLNSETGKCGL